jgi:hypothetical protein
VVKDRGDRGAALIMAILASALIGMAVMVLADDLNNRQRLFRQESRQITLGHLSDAVLAETLAELAADPQFKGLPLRKLGEGVIWSRVDTIAPGRADVVGEAEFDQWRGVIEAEVEMDAEGPRVTSWRKFTEPAQGSSRLLRKKSSNRL